MYNVSECDDGVIAQLVLNGGAHTAYTRVDGSFTFHDLPKGKPRMFPRLPDSQEESM
jgi:hypothetical protein